VNRTKISHNFYLGNKLFYDLIIRFKYETSAAVIIFPILIVKKPASLFVV